MPVFPLLGILFVGLKLTGYIAWSWLWVVAPFWIPLAVGLAFLAIACLVAGSIAGVMTLLGRRS